MDYKKLFDIGMFAVDGIIRAKKIYDEHQWEKGIERKRIEINKQPKQPVAEQHVFNEERVCIICGCSERIAKHFGWKCKGEPI